MLRLALAVLAVLCVTSPAAAADVRPLAARQDGRGWGPGLSGDRVIYAERDGRRAVRVLAQPLAGGPSTLLARIAAGAPFNPPAWELAAAPEGVALRVGSARTPAELWAGPPAGPLTLVQRPVRAAVRRQGEHRDLFATPDGPLVLERRGRGAAAVLRPPGRPPVRVPMPAGADFQHVAVADRLAAVPVDRQRAIAVVELPTGVIRHRLRMGEFADTLLIDLAVSPTGDVAFTVEDGTGADFLAWAPARAPEPRILLSGDGFELVRTAGGRIAMTQPTGASVAGERVVVLDSAGDVVFRGPPTGAVRTLDYDGAHVAWAAEGCQFVAPAQPGASTNRVPAGPCVRTEVAASRVLGRSGRALTMRLRCLTAPGARCGIDLRVYDEDGRVARHATSVPLHRLRTVRLPVPRSARGAPDRVVVVTRVVDPDGRRRITSPLL